MLNYHSFRPIRDSDLKAMLSLLPQLSDFNVPYRRNPEDLWRSDKNLLVKVAKNQAVDSFSEVLIDAHDKPIGLIIVTLRGELLSLEPSAHLEAIVVTPELRGKGLGAALLRHAEMKSQQKGARTLTLHVFSNNTRARGMYQKFGYDSELIRAIKWLD